MRSLKHTGASAKPQPQTRSTSSKKLKIPNLDDKLVEFILDEIVDSGQTVKFSDIGKPSLTFNILRG